MTNNIYNEVKAYVYEGIHKILGQIYYGVRTANIKKNRTVAEDFGIRYFTSSKKVKELGFNNFEWEIIATFDDPEEAYLFEDELIKLQWEKNKALSLNKHRAGHKWNTFGQNPLENKTEEEMVKFKQDVSNRFKNIPLSEEHKEKLRKPKCKGFGEKVSKRLKGIKHSPERIEKNRISHLGQIQTEETNEKRRQAMKYRMKTTEHKMKIGIANSKPKTKSTCPHCNKEGGAGNMTRYHFDFCIDQKFAWG